MSENSNFSFSEVCDFLAEAGDTLILTHMRPDADTLGSARALRELLHALGKRAEVVNADETIPRRLQFLYGTDSLRPERLPENFSYTTVIAVDVSAPALLGNLQEEYAPKCALSIDHHTLGTPFAAHTYIGDVGACGEIIADLFREFAVRGHAKLTREAAGALYAAICSDTGSFKFESVTPQTHERIAELLRTGIHHAEIARRLYDSRPISQVMATKAALNNLHFYHQNRIAVINFTQQMMADNHVNREDIDDIVSLTRSIEGVEIGVAIKQSAETPTTFKVSLRSNRVADVAKLCALFGGGGHKRAAGCTLTADNEYAAESMLLSEIERELCALDEAHAFDCAGEI